MQNRTRAMSIEDQVRTHIESVLAPDRKLALGLDTSLAGIVDSAGALELVIWVEDAFGFSVEIDQIAPEDFVSVRRLAEWIRRSGGALKD
jgi:acyl carrier protein